MVSFGPLAILFMAVALQGGTASVPAAEEDARLARNVGPRKCLYNGVEYWKNAVIEDIPEACARLVCKKKGRKAKVILKPVEGCMCSRGSLRTLEVESAPAGRVLESDFLEDTETRASEKCWFNRKWKVNSTVASLKKHCVEITCVYNASAMRAVLVPRFLPGCVCDESTTVAATNPTTKFPTNPPTEPQINPTTEPPTTPAACDYAKFSPTHSMLLPPNPECKAHRSGVTEEEKQEILSLHNTLRAKVARGDESQGDAGPQPKGADIRELVWNEELAQVAQAWASQCKGGHDGYANRKICSRNYAVGQNVFRKWGHNADSVWTEAIHSWYKEVAHMPKTYVKQFSGKPPSGKIIGHYTQLVWGATNEIGCGSVDFPSLLGTKIYPESKVYVCNYGRNGNTKSFPVYTAGPTASKCSEGKSTRYAGLCL